MEDPQQTIGSHQGSANREATPSPPPQSSSSVDGSGDEHSPMLTYWLVERDRSNLTINEVLVSEIQTK